MPFVIGAAIIGGVASLGGALISGSAARGAANMANQQVTDQLEYQKQQDALLEAQKQRYREFEFTNPYANLQNPFENMQNVYEDLTVNQEAARFQMEQGTQQRANIMQGLRGSAGSSGVAGLAQALSNQGRLQARQVSADISQQETANQRLAAQGAMRNQQMERQGLSAIQMAQAGGEMAMQEAEMQRQATLLGVSMQGAAGAASGVQQAYGNQMSMNMAGAQMTAQNAQAFGDMIGNIPWDEINTGNNNTAYSNVASNATNDQWNQFENAVNPPTLGSSGGQ
tara:strand:+ start:13419 stop:14267 length:849 start_codon:yes stop_codon:yes gene_type:complete